MLVCICLLTYGQPYPLIQKCVLNNDVCLLTRAYGTYTYIHTYMYIVHTYIHTHTHTWFQVSITQLQLIHSSSWYLTPVVLKGWDIHEHQQNDKHYQEKTVVSPYMYVGMAWKQDGSSNWCISNYMTIIWLGVFFFSCFKAPTCHIRMLPWPKRMSTSPKSITKVANWQPGKMRFLPSFLLLQPGERFNCCSDYNETGIIMQRFCMVGAPTI